MTFFERRNCSPAVLFLLALLGAQPHPGIHQRQWNYYRQHYQEPLYRPDTTAILPLQPRAFAPSRTVFGYHPYWEGTNWQDYNYDLLTTVAYFSAEVNSSGQLTHLHGWPVTGLINAAHAHGVKVVLCATLFNSSSMETLLSSADRRQTLITNLLSQVQAGQADGVNIDFEGLPASQKQNMVQFITDLTTTFHTQIPGSEVTLAMPAVDWNHAWDYSALAGIADGLFIMGYDYHWSGSSTTGAVAPLTGGTYNVSWSVSDYLASTGNRADKLILGVPYYGIEWPAVSSSPGAATTGTGSSKIYNTAVVLAATYGRNWDTNSQTPWYAYSSGGWHQGWYDDAQSLELKYDLALSQNLQGVGIWALGYDHGRQELWDLLASVFSGSGPPTAPQEVALLQADGAIHCRYSGAVHADYFRVLRYSDGATLTETLGPFSGNPFTINGLPTHGPSWIRIEAVNSFGAVASQDILGIAPATERAEALIVQGFDRETGTTNLHDTFIRHGLALAAGGLTFDGVTNEAVESGAVDLRNYGLVDWILGEEGSGSATFTAAEQAEVEAYLEAGGRLFVSGSEIGYDLVAQGNAADQAFYGNYLRAHYISDAAGGHQGVYQLSGTGIFSPLGSIAFDNGSHGTYDVDWPDGILPAEGATICATYPGIDPSAHGAAGIAFQGRFGTSQIDGRLIYLAVGFEAVYPATARTALMQAALDFLGLGPVIPPVDTTGTGLSLGFTNIYPNPASGEEKITITFRSDSSRSTALTIYTLRGERVVAVRIPPGGQEFVWVRRFPDQTPAPAGVYLATLRQGNRRVGRPFTLLK
ncbi:MAG: T9SS C-terminal target domain-containing protein [Candidatus Neomarinimicrobiota bacterium]|nr:MAG: T9SS C-terminal target domain-containing protein [Candidatus Neomarinimicrobiota bacterium]